MEEMFPILRNMLKEATQIVVNKEDLVIMIKVKPLSEIKGNLADPNEVKVMLHMFGGLKDDIPMEININNDDKRINIKFQSKEDMNKVEAITETIWDKTVDILEELNSGDLKRLKDIGEVDDD